MRPRHGAGEGRKRLERGRVRGLVAVFKDGHNRQSRAKSPPGAIKGRLMAAGPCSLLDREINSHQGVQRRFVYGTADVTMRRPVAHWLSLKSTVLPGRRLRIDRRTCGTARSLSPSNRATRSIGAAMLIGSRCGGFFRTHAGVKSPIFSCGPWEAAGIRRPHRRWPRCRARFRLRRGGRRFALRWAILRTNPRLARRQPGRPVR